MAKNAWPPRSSSSGSSARWRPAARAGPAPGRPRQRTLLALFLLDPGSTRFRRPPLEEALAQAPAAEAPTSRSGSTSPGFGRRSRGRPRSSPASGITLLDVARPARREALRAPATRGQDALGGEQRGFAAEPLHAALSLWRERARATLRDGARWALEARRLDDLRLSAVEERIEAELSLGITPSSSRARATRRRAAASRAALAPAGHRSLSLRATSRRARRLPAARNRSSSERARPRARGGVARARARRPTTPARPPRNRRRTRHNLPAPADDFHRARRRARRSSRTCSARTGWSR